MASAPIWYKDLTISSPSFSWFVTAKYKNRRDMFIVFLENKGVVRNYQGGRVANNRGRVMIFCAFKKEGLQFLQLSLRGGHDFSCHNLA